MTDAGLLRRLDAGRAELLGRIASLGGDVAEVMSAAEGSNADDEHDPEGATIAFERARLANQLSDAESALQAVDRAIARVAAGTYGICQLCSAPIARDRLLALPAAELCISCAAAAPIR